MDLRAKVERLEKTLCEYIERDKARLSEENALLTKELRTTRNTMTRLMAKIKKYEEKQKIAAKKIRELLKSE